MKKKKSNPIKKISTEEKNKNDIFIFIFVIFIVLVTVLYFIFNKEYNYDSNVVINDINKVDNSGLTIVMKSLLNEDRKLNINDIKRLIRDNRKNIDYKIRDSESKTLLMYAVFNGDKEIIKEIARYSNNINDIDNNGRTALHWAVYYNKYNAVVALIELGANTNIKDNYSLTPIDIAQYEGYEEIYEYLYKH